MRAGSSGEATPHLTDSWDRQLVTQPLWGFAFFAPSLAYSVFFVLPMLVVNVIFLSKHQVLVFFFPLGLFLSLCCEPSQTLWQILNISKINPRF